MTEVRDGIATQAGGTDLKPYRKPTLTKGPVLSDISAVGVSGKEL